MHTPTTPTREVQISANADFITPTEPVGSTRVYAPHNAPKELVQAAARYALQTALDFRSEATLANEGYEFAPEGPVWAEDGDGTFCWQWDWHRFNPVTGDIDYRD